MSVSAQNVVACGCLVGESLIWDDRRGLLFWVDMLGHKIHAYDPEKEHHETWETPGMVTSIGLRQDGGYVVGLQKTVVLWTPGGAFSTLAELEQDLPFNRLNEGVVGPDGCFWVGTMQNNVDANNTPIEQTEKTGQVWRITPDGQVQRMSNDQFWLTNTIAWLGDRLVIGDTSENALFSYSWPPIEGALGDKTVFFEGYDKGLPDGSCVDAKGHLWNCRVVGGAQVLRIGPQGEPQQHVVTPCTWPTSCAFGGASLEKLYITSARFNMSDAHLRSAPWEGDLFACKIPGVKGQKQNRFG